MSVICPDCKDELTEMSGEEYVMKNEHQPSIVQKYECDRCDTVVTKDRTFGLTWDQACKEVKGLVTAEELVFMARAWVGHAKD